MTAVESLPDLAEPHTLLATLTPGRTFLCSDISSNILVLKKLDDDCLHERGLHPSIRERLAHVRDLPHGRLATLRGVERWGGQVPQQVFMVWSWLDGETWEEAIEKPLDDFGWLASSLVEAVEALHEMGLVHGSLHAGNVIVRRDRQVWITDVSPYLYTDPAVDIAAVVELLHLADEQLPANVRDRLKVLLDDLQRGELDLRQLSRALRGIDEPDTPVLSDSLTKAPGYRVSSILAAAAVALCAVGIWLGIRHLAAAGEAGPKPFPSLKTSDRALP